MMSHIEVVTAHTSPVKIRIEDVIAYIEAATAHVKELASHVVHAHHAKRLQQPKWRISWSNCIIGIVSLRDWDNMMYSASVVLKGT